MSDPLSALLAATRAVLQAQGHAETAALLADATLSIFGPDQVWNISGRTVSAQTVIMSVQPATLAVLFRSAGMADSHADLVRLALGNTMRGPTVELADFRVVARLPNLAAPWQSAYRDVVRAHPEERPSAEAVKRAVIELLAARDRPDLAEVLTETTIESVTVASESASLVRYVVRLAPAALVRLERDVEGVDEVRRAITDVGTRADESVTSIELRARAD